MSTEESYYEILQVSKNATTQEIKKQYKKLALKYHPDRLPEDKKKWGEEMFKKLAEAYEVLSDPEKKNMYDQFGKEGLKGTNMPDMSNISEILKRFGFQGHHSHKREQTVEPVKFVVNVTLEDIYNGKTFDHEIERNNLCGDCVGTGYQDKQHHKCTKCNGNGAVMEVRQLGPGFITKSMVKCNGCNGSGKDINGANKCKKCNGKCVHIEKHMIKGIVIPKGVEQNHTITINNQGHEIPLKHRNRGVTRGDVEVIVNELPHDLFKRGLVINQSMNPANILIVLDISLADAIMGFKKSFEHLDGRHLYFEETEVVKDGDIRVILDEGLPYKNKEHKTGDLFIKYNVVYPDNLSYESKLNTYKALTGKSFEYTQMPSDYKQLTSLSIDMYQNTQNSHSYYDSDSDERDDNRGAPECATQ